MEIEHAISLKDTEINEPYYYTYWQMANNRIFYIDGEIAEDILTLQKHILAINIYDKDHDISVDKRMPIIIMINSPGGYLTETMSLCATIKLSKTPIYTVNIGEASSGAALVLVAGHKKFALPYSTVLIHSGSGSTVGTYEQTVEQNKNYKKQVDTMRNFILENTEIPTNIFNKNKSKEWYLDTDEAMKYKVIDEVITDIDTIIGD